MTWDFEVAFEYPSLQWCFPSFESEMGFAKLFNGVSHVLMVTLGFTKLIKGVSHVLMVTMGFSKLINGVSQNIPFFEYRQ